MASDSDIRHDVEKELVDAGRVTIEAHGDEVVLGGTVHSWAERDEAERAAWAAPGVSRVDNRIEVSS